MATIAYIYNDGQANENSRITLSNDPVFNNKEYPPKYYQGMGIFTPGEQRNTEYLKLKYSPSIPESEVYQGSVYMQVGSPEG